MGKEMKWASFVSGGGTTMNEMGRAIQRDEVPGVRLELVIASKPGIGAIEKAKALGLTVDQIVVVNPKDYIGEDGRLDQYEFGRQILIELKKRGVEFFTQNGWIPPTPDRVIDEFAGFNQHPQRVPEFGGTNMYGIRPHAARLNYAHLAGESSPTSEPVAQRISKGEYDGGEVVVFESVPITNEILSEDMEYAAPALQKHVLPAEHRVQIELLRQMRSGTLHRQELPQLHAPRMGTVFDAALLARQQAVVQFSRA